LIATQSQRGDKKGVRGAFRMFTRHWIESLARFVIAEVLPVAPAFILMYVPGKLATDGVR